MPAEVFSLALEVAAEVPMAMAQGSQESLAIAVEAISDRIALGLAEASAADQRTSRASWKDWVLKALAGGASMGHRYSRLK